MTFSTYTLKSGNKIPAIAYGLGTKWYKGADSDKLINQQIVDSLVNAIDVGFPHIDTAEVYGNYPEFAAALKKIDRTKVYITDKFNPAIKDPTHKPYDVLKKTLSFLGLDYVDLYLIHSPFIDESNGFTLEEAWEDLVKLQKEGLAKDIGVSNFRVEDLKRLNPAPAVNQIEFSAYLQDQTPGVLEYSQENDILVEAYGSLAPVTTPGPLEDYLSELSKKYNRTTGDIILRWDLQRGILPVTTSSNKERLAGFLTIEEFKLTDEEVSKISEIGKGKHVRKFWGHVFE